MSSPPCPVVLLESQSSLIGEPEFLFVSTAAGALPAWQTTAYGTGWLSRAFGFALSGSLLMMLRRFASPPAGTIGSGGRSALTDAGPSSTPGASNPNTPMRARARPRDAGFTFMPALLPPQVAMQWPTSDRAVTATATANCVVFFIVVSSCSL